MCACEKGKQCEEALVLLQEVTQQLLNPDVVSWSASMSACEEGRQCEEAPVLLQEMMQLLLKPMS